MARIYFAGDDNFEKEFADGVSLQEAIDKSGADIMFGCREGACATCMIEVLSGMENINPPTDNEKTTLLPEELRRNVRLACQCRVKGGAIRIQRAEGSL